MLIIFSFSQPQEKNSEKTELVKYILKIKINKTNIVCSYVCIVINPASIYIKHNLILIKYVWCLFVMYILCFYSYTILPVVDCL